MEKDNTNHQLLSLRNREKFTADCVENVEMFSCEQIILKTALGGLDIKGSDLKLSDFSVEEGTIILEGKIDSVVFVSIKEKGGFLKGLFR